PRGVSREERLSVIRGQVRSATDYPEGCRFAERCDHAAPRCEAAQPPLFATRAGGRSACYLQDPDDPLPRQETGPQVTAALDRGSGPGEVLLEVRDLTTHFPIRAGFFKRTVGHVRAVDRVSLAIRDGTTL
ncbi:MAG: ABC transporter ATP-binding protein, partial [Gammaproteobacteria bacterium]|nr:ABC transporter ATP-binding protein [Gammaproteobacteria bacterium]